MNFISILDMITSIYSEPLIHMTTKVTEVTHTGPWNDKYCTLVQINILLTIITAMLHSRANGTELDCTSSTTNMASHIRDNHPSIASYIIACNTN